MGWILCYGLFYDCVIQPFTHSLPVIAWEPLLTGLGIVLGISGVRDVGLHKRGGRNVRDIDEG